MTIMKAFFIQLGIQFKTDLKDKQTLIVYYIIPLAFFFLVGYVMSSIVPENVNSLMSAFTIFAVSMPAYLGLPSILVRLKEKEVIKSYRAGGIPAWAAPLSHTVNTCFHMIIVSIFIFVFSPLIFKCAYPENILVYFSEILLVIICSTALGVMISGFSKNQGTVTMLGQLLFMPTVLLSGIMFPSSMLPDALKYIGYILPGTHGMLLINGGLYFWYPLGALLLSSATGTILSLYRYKKLQKSS